jgi:DNA-binding MarR family transcriptional regulator
MNDNMVKLENQLCHRFYSVSNAFTRAYRPMLTELDLPYPQYVVMMGLWEKDDVAISDLLAQTRVDGGAMTQILKKLEQKGYITLSSADGDKRSKKVELTDVGQQLQPAAIDIASEMRCKFKHLTVEEAQQLMELT